MRKKITVYGFGYVGKALWRFLKDHYEVRVFDPYATPDYENDAIFWTSRDKNGKPDYSAMNDDYAVVCVPTPMSDDGSCDTSVVEDILENSRNKYYLIKSTIKPGTTETLIKKTGKNIAFSPEYIGEGKYEMPYWLDYPHPTEMKKHSFHIFGGDKTVTTKWIEIWQKIAGWTAKYIQTTSTTAELVKYAENAFLATKNAYFNELYEIAKVFNIDYNELKELLLLDGRIGRSHSLVFPDNRGFGGKCLPKDVNAIVYAARERGYETELIKQVLESNKKFRSQNNKGDLD